MWRGREGLFLGLASLSLSLFSLASEPNKLGGGKTDMSDIHPSVLADPTGLVGWAAATRDSITEQLFPALIGAEEQEGKRNKAHLCFASASAFPCRV